MREKLLAPKPLGLPPSVFHCSVTDAGKVIHNSSPIPLSHLTTHYAMSYNDLRNLTRNIVRCACNRYGIAV